MKFLLLVFFFLLMSVKPVLSNAQNLSGTWTGSASDGSYVEFVLAKCGDGYVGYTYDKSIGYCKANFAGTYDSATGKLKGKGMGFIEKTFGHGQATYNLHYSESGGRVILKGTASPKSAAAKIFSFGMSVSLTITRESLAVDTTPFIREALAANPLQKINDIDSVMGVAGAGKTNASGGEITLKTRASRATDTIQTIITNEQKVIIKLLIME